MSDLRKMQAMFQEAVMKSEGDFLCQIEEGGKISPEKRLHIYQHAYRARLRSVLVEDFPVLHTMLGDGAFYELCNRYIDAYPSSYPSLGSFGQHLEKFVAQENPYKTQPIITELARFERTFHAVFDALDQKGVSVEEVGALPPSVWTILRFEFHPSLFIGPFDWNVAAVWSSVKAEDDSPTLPEKMAETTYVIQWRRDLVSYFRTLDRDEAKVLLLARNKKAFPEICESLFDDHGANAPGRAAELLKKWVVEGLVTRLDCGGLAA